MPGPVAATGRFTDANPSLAFTIVIGAQLVSGSNVLAEQRAVAVVWRDPYPAPLVGNPHPTVVRFFAQGRGEVTLVTCRDCGGVRGVAGR